MVEMQSSSDLSGIHTPSSDAAQKREPSKEALSFIESLCDADFRGIVFDDQLTTFSDLGKEVGEFKVSVTESMFFDEPCFRIHAVSHGLIDNIPCGTSVTALVSKRLETLEQQHHEFLKLLNHPIDRRTIISRQDQDYVIDLCVKQGEETLKYSRSYSSEIMKGVICEGSNLLLLRILSKKGIPSDQLTFLSFDSEINLCQTTYKMLEEQREVVGSRDVEAICIERTLFTSQEDLMTWRCYLTNKGRLVKRLQVGSPVVMMASSVPEFTEPDDTELSEPKPVFHKQPLNWEEDMEMRSKHEDRKKELIADHSTYMTDHRELRDIISDFVQFLLMRKPTDVLSFSAEYFESFSKTGPENRCFLNSQTPQRHPDVKSNQNIDLLSKVP